MAEQNVIETAFLDELEKIASATKRMTRVGLHVGKFLKMKTAGRRGPGVGTGIAVGLAAGLFGPRLAKQMAADWKTGRVLRQQQQQYGQPY